MEEIKNYYLTKMRYEFLGTQSEITQLVKASSENNARIATREAAEATNKDIVILEIRVHETIIGE
jgi:hypothetical protein